MEKENSKKNNEKNKITKEKIKENLSLSKSKLIDLKLPSLQNFLKRHFNKKRKKKTKRNSYNFPLSHREPEIEKIKKKVKTLSDISLGNPNKTLDYSGYNSSNNEKKLINGKLEKNNYSLFPFNKSLRKSIINKSNDLSFFNNKSIIRNSNNTIINIYNTSVKTSPKIYLLSSYVNSSTSCHNTTHSKNSSNNIINLKKFKRSNHLNLNDDYIEELSYKNEIKSVNRTKTTNYKFVLKKKITIDSMDKELSSIINNDFLNKSYIPKKSSELNIDDTFNNIENESFETENQINEINKELKKKFLKKFKIDNQSYQFINYKKDYKNSFINFFQNKVKKILNEKIKKKRFPNKREILNNYYKCLFKENKLLKRVEKYLIKKIRYPDINKIAIIHSSINKFLLNDLEDFTYHMIISFVFEEDNIIGRFYINRNEFLKKKNKLNIRHVNLSFITEKFIIHDVIIQNKDEIKKENEIKRLLTDKNNLKKMIKKGKKMKFIRANTKKFSIFNNIKTTFSLLNRRNKNLIREREGEKITYERRNSYIKSLKLTPTAKVQNIKFHIEDEQKEMTKTRDMSKEHLIFRTEEIKIDLKKQLKTIEEILFFLIRENNFREFKEILERYHVSLESRNENNDTFLIYATQCGYEEFIQFLIQKGANLDAQNFDLNTALHYAINSKRFNIADLLLKEGACETIVNKYSLTPWEFN